MRPFKYSRVKIMNPNSRVYPKMSRISDWSLSNKHLKGWMDGNVGSVGEAAFWRQIQSLSSPTLFSDSISKFFTKQSGFLPLFKLFFFRILWYQGIWGVAGPGHPFILILRRSQKACKEYKHLLNRIKTNRIQNPVREEWTPLKRIWNQTLI